MRPSPPHSMLGKWSYSQRDRSVGQRADGQRVHQVHIVAQHSDSDALPARILGPVSRALTAVKDQVGAGSAALAPRPQEECQAEHAERSHRGLAARAASSPLVRADFAQRLSLQFGQTEATHVHLLEFNLSQTCCFLESGRHEDADALDPSRVLVLASPNFSLLSWVSESCHSRRSLGDLLWLSKNTTSQNKVSDLHPISCFGAGGALSSWICAHGLVAHDEMSRESPSPWSPGCPFHFNSFN